MLVACGAWNGVAAPGCNAQAFPDSTLAGAVAPSPGIPSHSWPAADRHQHLSLSFACGLGAGIAASSPTAAALCPLALGVAKEAWDSRGAGWDAVDLAADLLGAALAVWAVSRIER